MIAPHDADPAVTTSSAARVLLIDDHALVRDGMRMHLTLHRGWKWSGKPTMARPRWRGWRQPKPDACRTS